MDPNTIFFWAMFGPVCAFAVVGIGGAVLMLLGATVEAVNSWLLQTVREWRAAGRDS